ncbi:MULTISPECIES: DddA-like double-stranded DNA deaminase toxin [unclassified Crossiella]|uniref:DddA-like double-stranded DNA deaminase toxin n=1 Tax=unclassified Crossiella TaxID=2620835 RepID=UPI001FFFB1C3|nr:MULTISPECIES: DddA-like double-stranded DNA deaminase toxin [unclassified Crossiella]MCK2237739.1 hypothetical protein [Crossiella sp. S99.2]MCK2255025.1 hypothetical protein [Crossiella sp. S99.1]
MTSEGEVAENLRAQLAGLPVDGLDGCQRELEGHRRALAQMTETTGAALLVEAADQMALADGHLNTALSLAARARAEAESWIAGGTPAPAPTVPPAERVATTPAVVPRPEPASPAARWATDPRPIPDRVADIVKTLPLRSARNKTTLGVWIDDRGGVSDAVRSGSHDYADAVAELRKLELSPPNGDLAITTHVETKLAVRMRRSEGVREVHLVINHQFGPCPGWNGCAAILPSILRPGQRLVVYWPDGDSIRSETFEGLESQ